VPKIEVGKNALKIYYSNRGLLADVDLMFAMFQSKTDVLLHDGLVQVPAR
jgi:hypothetical protein